MVLHACSLHWPWYVIIDIFTLFHIQTSSSSTYQPPVWLMLFSCIRSHSLELTASQRSFLWISNNFPWKHLETFLFSSGILWRPPSDPLPLCLRFSSWFWLFINWFTYLLTVAWAGESAADKERASKKRISDIKKRYIRTKTIIPRYCWWPGASSPPTAWNGHKGHSC